MAAILLIHCIHPAEEPHSDIESGDSRHPKNTGAVFRSIYRFWKLWRLQVTCGTSRVL